MFRRTAGSILISLCQCPGALQLAARLLVKMKAFGKRLCKCLHVRLLTRLQLELKLAQKLLLPAAGQLAEIAGAAR